MLEQIVTTFMKKHSLLENGSRMLVGVSGGPDSLALLHYLWTNRSNHQWHIVVGHVDHMFRGEESLADLRYVESFCTKHNIPFVAERIPVPEYINETGKSTQIAARECRYHFYQSTMVKYNLSTLVLGHHGDDQVETILMRMTRGSTGKARAGISVKRPFSNGEMIRPFLCVTKEEIYDYLYRHDLHFREDPSNQKDVYTRNRFRHHVLPALKKENPRVHEQFQRFSERILEDEDYLEELTVEKLNTVLKNRDRQQISIDINRFLLMPIPLQRRSIQLILNYLYEEKPSSLSAVHIEMIFNLLLSHESSSKLIFPDQLMVIRSYNDCIFHIGDFNQSSPYDYTLSDVGTLTLPNNMSITLQFVSKVQLKGGNDGIYLAPSSLPITIRTREKGDRISLKGMNGSKKIKDIFIDRKIPLHKRDQWPVVTDKDGTIVWLPGLKKSKNEEESILSNLSTYIYLKYEKSCTITN